MTRLISSAVIESLQGLHRLCQSERLDQYAAEVPRALWEDELGRLRVWAANIGAHQTGQSSLDFRLRDSSHVRQTILRVLERMERIMRDLQEVLDDSVMDEDFISDFSDSEDDLPEQKEVQSIYLALRDTVNNLFQMSITIRQPAQSDRLRGTKRSDAAAFEPFDRGHVYNKFPTADENILNRLALAISQRRAILRYRERHHAKLAHGISGVLTGHTDTESVPMSDTVATEFVEVPEPERPSDDTETAVSQTSYAQSMMQGKDQITMPPPPKGTENGIPFECPYCFGIACIQNRLGWARHVFNDLMPYICIFPDCATPHRLYQSRREWFHHLQSRHSQDSDSSSDTSCGLCHSSVAAGKPLERHLGRHLEELALFALPTVDADESGEDVNSNHASDDTEDHYNEDLLKYAMDETHVPDISSPSAEDPPKIDPFASQSNTAEYLGSKASATKGVDGAAIDFYNEGPVQGHLINELSTRGAEFEAAARIEQRAKASEENNETDPTRRSAASLPSSLVAEPPEPLPHSPHVNFGVMGDPMDDGTKRRRGNLPKPITDILRTWFHEHLDHPYPSEEDKQMFMTRTGLSMSQISNWFINARRRQLPALRNQMRSADADSSRHSPFSDVDETMPSPHY